MSGRYSPGGDPGQKGAAAPRPRRRQGTPLKPGSAGASPPPSVEVQKAGGRRARIEASRAAMARNDELRRQREAEADG